MRLEYKTYEEAKKDFRWSERWEVFDGNRWSFKIADECVSRHGSEEIAIRIKFDDRHKEVYTFREFDRLVSQFANLLERLEIHQGDRYYFLLPLVTPRWISCWIEVSENKESSKIETVKSTTNKIGSLVY